MFAFIDCAVRLKAAKQLAAQDPRIDAFLVDDFSSVTLDTGLKPSDIARFQYLNACEFPQLPLMGTVYTMTLDKPVLKEFLPYFAGYLTPLWHAADIAGLPADVDRLAGMSGGKPQLLCIYLYDFGNGVVVSYDLMRRQLEVAEDLLRAQKVFGVVVLGTCLMDLPWESNRCFSDWLKERGDKAL